MSAALSATVVVLTYDAEPHIADLLDALEAQDHPGLIEVLVIDSGSTDRTLEIVAAHPSVRLHRIPNAEFGHGRTRDLGARLATGDVVAYLTDDAVPAGPEWLRELVAPLADDERIAAVVGRQRPRPDAVPVVKHDIRRVFERLGPDHSWSVTRDAADLDEDARWRAAFYSDANSAARRSLLVGDVPYRDVDYAEDQRLARDLIDAGHRIAYAPRAVAWHSNEVTLRTFRRRIEDELRGLAGIGVALPPVSRRAAFAQFVKWSTADAAAIVLDREVSVPRRLRWLLVNPWYHVAKWRAHLRASGTPPRED